MAGALGVELRGSASPQAGAPQPPTLQPSSRGAAASTLFGTQTRGRIRTRDGAKGERGMGCRAKFRPRTAAHLHPSRNRATTAVGTAILAALPPQLRQSSNKGGGNSSRLQPLPGGLRHRSSAPPGFVGASFGTVYPVTTRLETCRKGSGEGVARQEQRQTAMTKPSRSLVQNVSRPSAAHLPAA